MVIDSFWNVHFTSDKLQSIRLFNLLRSAGLRTRQRFQRDEFLIDVHAFDVELAQTKIDADNEPPDELLPEKSD
jgi:hypothetical protein